eukprot:gnl/MRDRNA2_/MRDRNA2_93184_c0_seq1.p1 gnl/MRDRNA2_/MRDRNA2_93184_c0~~gnl/MRDRNA2_/MRDRNA2_93184_c0_seq1.p1  ORF type:complete len:341 (-),score=90.67 gnl/MRDRNA2_/MRDRNA2_93184_c0_seq1:19-1041(-)
MISNALVLVLGALPLTNGLLHSRKEPTKLQHASSESDEDLSDPWRSPSGEIITIPGQYAYVTMWMAKNHVPKNIQLDEDVMTPEEEEAALKEEEEKGHMDRTRLKEMKVNEMKLMESMTEESLEDSVVPATGSRGSHLAIKMAKDLKKVGSEYPLVILTNVPSLFEIATNETWKEKYPNVVIQQIGEEDYIKHTCRLAPLNKYHFQKIQIFGLEDYDKLLWMDLDVQVQRNLDSLFDESQYPLGDGDTIWGQSDNWNCEGKNAAKSRDLCSGMMLFKPSQKHLEGLKEQGRQMNYCWGDQKLIAKYFSKKNTKTKKIFPRSVVNWQHCGARNSMAAHKQK